jgi:hypothetical protein
VPFLSRLAAIALALALAFALALTETAQVVFTYDGIQPISFGDVLVRGLPAWLLLGLLAPLVALVCRRWRLDLRAGAIARHAAMSLVFAGAHIVLLAAVKTGGRWPEMAFADAVRSAVFYNLVADVLIYWTIAGMVQVLDNSRRLRQREAEALALEASLAEARLDALRAQLEPHFLYNVLNTAAMLAREQRGEETVAVLARLAELLRHVLREGGPGETALGDEIVFLRSYLELERLRFAGRLEIEIDIDPALAGLRLPSLLLQPLVENAIRHGISQRPGAGKVSIRARRRGHEIAIEVRDDGPGIGASQGSARDGIGLANTRDRLAQRYGEAARLDLESAPDGGTCARITVRQSAFPGELAREVASR